MEKASATISGDKLSLALQCMFNMSSMQKRTEVPAKENGKKTVFNDLVFATLDQKIPGDTDCWRWYSYWSAGALVTFFTVNVLPDLANVRFSITPTVVAWITQPTLQKAQPLTPENRTLLQERFTRFLNMVACDEISEEILRQS